VKQSEKDKAWSRAVNPTMYETLDEIEKHKLHLVRMRHERDKERQAILLAKTNT
jgi:hypothetical protein